MAREEGVATSMRYVRASLVFLAVVSGLALVACPGGRSSPAKSATARNDGATTGASTSGEDDGAAAAPLLPPEPPEFGAARRKTATSGDLCEVADDNIDRAMSAILDASVRRAATAPSPALARASWD